MTTKSLPAHIKTEIERLHQTYGYDLKVLTTFAQFVRDNPKPPKPPKSLTLPKIKKAIFEKFNVNDVTALRKNGKFQMATDGIGKLNFSQKATWEQLYRDLIGILPGEENQTGPDCINGVNIFNYFRPWQVLGLEPENATEQDIKNAYYRLSKIYHPDSETGDRRIFERIELMYSSLIKAP